MSGDLLRMAREDFEELSSTGGFEEDIIITNPLNLQTASFKNFHTKHHLAIDTDGNPYNSQSAHICVLRKELDNQSYIYINPKTNKIDFRGHRVTVKDSFELKTYVVNEFLPNETLGFIILILGDFKST